MGTERGPGNVLGTNGTSQLFKTQMEPPFTVLSFTAILDNLWRHGGPWDLFLIIKLLRNLTEKISVKLIAAAREIQRSDLFSFNFATKTYVL